MIIVMIEDDRMIERLYDLIIVKKWKESRQNKTRLNKFN